MFKGDKVKARVSKTNKFREVTLRRDAEMKEDLLGLYAPTPAYLHSDGKTVSGVVYEYGNYDRWVFKATGKYSNLI